jgi:hypothetical protein
LHDRYIDGCRVHAGIREARDEFLRSRLERRDPCKSVSQTAPVLDTLPPPSLEGEAQLIVISQAGS